MLDEDVPAVAEPNERGERAGERARTIRRMMIRRMMMTMILMIKTMRKRIE